MSGQRLARPGLAWRHWCRRVLLWVLLVAPVGLALAQPASEAVKLKVGDKAPPYAVGRWLQGGPMEKVLTNSTTVVYFWTSISRIGWIGMSRMEGMREVFGPHGVSFLGVRVWDHPQEGWEQVQKQVGPVQLPLMVDAVSGPQQGVMATTWLEAAAQTGAPVVFVVHDGRIAWIGHPLALPETLLRKLLEGTFRWDRAAHDYAGILNNEPTVERHWKSLQVLLENNDWIRAHETLRNMSGLMPMERRAGLVALRFQLLMAENRMKEAVALAEELVRQFPEEPHLLNLLAWEMATNDDFEKPDYDLILRIAERANASSYERDAAILDTYARALFLKGRKEDAIRAQEKAVKYAAPQDKSKMAEVLRYYQRGQLPPVED